MVFVVLRGWRPPLRKVVLLGYTNAGWRGLMALRAIRVSAIWTALMAVPLCGWSSTSHSPGAQWISRSGRSMPVRILEHDPQGVLHLECESRRGTIEVITGLRIEGDTAYLDGLHVGGPGTGAWGIAELRRCARELGRELGVRRLVIHGGVRTSGANPGRVPRPIVLRLPAGER
jgi:hypothetical protein